MIKPEKEIRGTKWIETVRLTPEERQQLMKEYGIDEDIIEYVVDKDESTNFVHDINEDDQLFIFWRRMFWTANYSGILPDRLGFCYTKGSVHL